MARRTLVLCVALAIPLLVWLVHGSTLDAGFTLDDRAFLEHNAAAQAWPGLERWLLSPFPPWDPGRGLYRPLTTLSYVVDGALFGHAAAGYHAGNLVLYALCCGLVLVVALRYLDSVGAAAFATLLFLLHPVHCEVVDSISGRSELLALVMALLSWEAFARATCASRQARRSRWTLSWVSALCLGLAMLSKETGLMVLAVIALHRLATGRGRAGALLAPLLPHLLVVGLYVALRVRALAGGVVATQTVLGDAPLPTLLWTQGAIALQYARLLLYPSTLQIDFYYQHAPGVQRAPSAQALLGLLLLLGLIALCIRLLLQLRAAFGADRAGDADAMSSLPLCRLMGLGSLLLFLLPYSHLVPFGALMAERFLFAPSLGFCLLAASWLPVLARRAGGAATLRILLPVVVGALLLALGARSYARALDWQDTRSLFTALLPHAPSDARVYTQLAAGHLEHGEQRQALALLARSLELDPDRTSTHNNLAFVLLEQGQLEQAEHHLQRSLELDPAGYLAHNGMGRVQGLRGRLVAAERHFERALQHNPSFTTATNNLRDVRQAIARARSDLQAVRAAGGGAPSQRLKALCTALELSPCQ